MPSNAAAKRVTHRAALAAAALWWGVRILQHELLHQPEQRRIVVHMLGLPVCYAPAYLGVYGIAWIVANFRS